MTDRRDDKAISEVIGYIFVVSIVFISIGMVYTNVIPILEDAQEHERIDNVEQTYSVLQDNLQEVVERNVPSRATEIRLTDSTVQTDENVYINATVYEPPPTGTEPTIQDDNMTALSPITNEVSGEEIIYENGAVFRGDGVNYAMVYEPRWVVEENFSIVHSIVTQGNNRVGGSGTVLVRGESSDEVSELGEEKGIKVTIDSPRASSWRDYFEDFEHADTVGFNESGGIDGMDRVNVTIEPDQRVIHVRNNMGIEVRE